MGRMLVVGVGNVLLRDEGVGVWVARALKTRPLPEGVEVVDLGTSCESLLALTDGVEKLVIVDAMMAGLEPGTVLRLRPEDLEGRPMLLSSRDFPRRYVPPKDFGKFVPSPELRRTRL